MLPETLTTIPGDGWLMEPKWDGARMLIVVEDAVEIYGRRGIDYTRKLGLHAEALASLPAGTVLDSELVCLRVGADGRVSDDWSGAQSIVSSGQTTRAQQETVQLVVFDVMSYDGHDCRTLTLVERRAFLERVFEEHDFGEAVILTPQMESSKANYEALVAAGFEGAMVKRLDSRYVAGGRGRGWGRLKHTTTDDYVVVGWEPGNDSFAGMFGALRLAQYIDGELVECCKVGTGWKVPERRALSADCAALVGRVVEVKTYAGIKQRHPVFVRWREDKAPEDCRAEEAIG
jgi:bifunctional non-homologous end joining protein LigD